jgi:predicted methyltransferase
MSRYHWRLLGIAVVLGATLTAGLPSRAARAQDYAAIVAATDRSDADRKTDTRRDPVRLLGFVGVKEGMTVLDMGAGGGYSTELLARTVGPTGKVYAQNEAGMNARAKAAFAARAKTPAMQTVVAVSRSYDDPIPPGAGPFDLITFFFAYHDTTFMPVDRPAMNRKLFAALKAGGVLVVADHSARPEDGVTVGKTLHRIAEASLRQEVEAAGFKLVTQGDFLRHPEDPRNVVVFRSQTPVDEFVLKFEKPR